MVQAEGKEPIEIPKALPLLPVRDIVIFNHMFLPLYVGRESSISAVDEALSKDRLICIATQKDPNNDNPKPFVWTKKVDAILEKVTHCKTVIGTLPYSVSCDVKRTEGVYIRKYFNSSRRPVIISYR